MKIKFQIALIAFFTLCWISQHVSAQQLNEVVIRSPSQGQKVGAYVIAEVFASIRDDSKVWVLAHIRQLGDLWYPQRAPIKNDRGNWEAYVRIGEPPDIGLDFEIAAATFDKDAEREILLYHERGKQTGRWEPIPLPPTTSNVSIVTVRKVSH